MEVILIVVPVSFKSPKEPTRLNGIVVMTMKENFGERDQHSCSHIPGGHQIIGEDPGNDKLTDQFLDRI